MSIARAVAGIALWGGFLVAMASWSNTLAALVGAGIGTVVFGVLAGRWWVLLVPIVPGALLALASLVSDPDDYYEGSPGDWAAFIALWAIAIAALLGLGVAINRSVARVRTRKQWREHPDRGALT